MGGRRSPARRRHVTLYIHTFYEIYRVSFFEFLQHYVWSRHRRKGKRSGTLERLAARRSWFFQFSYYNFVKSRGTRFSQWLNRETSAWEVFWCNFLCDGGEFSFVCLKKKKAIFGGEVKKIFFPFFWWKLKIFVADRAPDHPGTGSNGDEEAEEEDDKGRRDRPCRRYECLKKAPV